MHTHTPTHTHTHAERKRVKNNLNKPLKGDGIRKLIPERPVTKDSVPVAIFFILLSQFWAQNSGLTHVKLGLDHQATLP